MRTRFITAIENKIFKSTFVHTCVLLSLLFAVALPTRAQETPKRGFNVGNSYAIGDIETVNLTNGNVMIRFPLGQLPVGRNGLTTGFYLTYNSKIYDSKIQYFENQTQYCPNPGGCYYQKQLLEQNYEGGGWRYSSGYVLSGENRLSQFQGLPTSQQPLCTSLEMRYIYKMYVTFPDGSKHEMIPYGHSDVLQDGFYNVRGDGVIEGGCGSQSKTGYPMTYYSVDGSYLRLEYSYDNDFDGSNNTFVLHFPDGMRYESATDRVYDRNNSYIQFGNQISDEFGRTITKGYDSATGEDTVTVKGYGGENLVWRVKWKQIFVNKKYMTYLPDTWPGCTQTHTCPPNADPDPIDKVFSVVERITLPSQAGNLSYTFSYNAHNYITPLPTEQSVGLGELSGITMPSGAQVSYGYELDNQTTNTTSLYTADALANKITGKTLTYNREYDGTTTPVTESWGYGILQCGGGVTGPDGGATSEDFGCGGWKQGLSLRTTAPDGTKVEKVWAQNYPIECTSTQFYCNQNARNPYVKTEFISIKDKDGQYRWTAIKDYSYDKNGNVTQVVEYDWVPYESVERESPSSGNYPTGAIPSQATPVLKRITATGYYASTPDASANLGTNPTSSQYPNLYIWRTSPRLRSTSAWSEVRNGSNQAVTRTENSYDDPFTTGNLTQVKMWDSFKGGVNRPYSDPLTTDNSISISTQYNQYGMPILTTDARGTQTQIIYGPIAGPNGTVTDLYPTETKAAYNTSVQKIARMEYDFYTGLVTRATDVDNNVSLSTVYDALGRPTLVKAAEGTAIETRTATEYNDAQRYVVVRADLNTTGDGKRVSIQNYDQLGRVRLSRTLEDSATQSAYNESDGVKIQTRYLYSGNYSYQIVSNPYRAATSSQATNELTMGWSRTKIDNGGRVREIETFSGASLPSPLGSNTSSTGVVVTDYDANTTTVKEQSGKRRKSETNALGQLVKVTEDPNLTGYTGLNYETTYTYDTLSNLVQVNQGVQTRTFTYSSLGRLLTATNPEGGIITYTYDSGGNLLTKRDARNITTTFTYDELSRIRTRSYSDGITPAVTYTYDDSAVAFGKGKLTKVSSSVSETRYASYDPLGRVTSSQQITAGLEVCPGTTQLCSMSYVYNLAGALVSQTYPSGRVVKNVFDNTGDLLRVFGKLSNKPEMTYASEFKYTPSGSVNQTRLGNGRWESTQLNSRLQPVQIALGTTQNATDLLKLNYEYGELDQSGNVDTTKNNGNVVKQTITVPQMAHPLVQNYSYDVLNRVTEAKETSNGSQQWIQTFTYDRYGNRRIDSATNKTTSSLVGPNPVISETNNRIVAQQGEQYDYDSAGNLTKDKDGNQFFYDAENRQVTYRQAGSPTDTAYYAYDGDGRRVKKVFNSITTIFVYSASGKLVEEYETTTPPTNGKIQYLTNDMLGSPRVLTDASGQVTSRRDFHPFGEEIIALGGRTSDYKYSQPDNVNQKFTGQLRDAESGLDYFNARYYASAHGRFTSVDPIFTTLERLIDPQQINLYIYTRDNPLRFVDPSGMILELEASSEDDAKAKLELLKKGLKPKDRNHIQLVVGDGKNGFAKGTFGITVDKNHKSNSGNFNAIKKISEDTGATAELAFRGPNDKVDVYFGTEKNGKVQLVSFKDQVGQDFHLGPNEGAVGWTAMPAPNPVVPTSYPNYSADNKTRAFVFTGQSDVEVVKTIFHELAAHVALSNVGRDPSKGKESDPVVQKEIKRAESEAAKNFKQK